MVEFHVIGDHDTVAGFRYAGVQGTVVSDGDEAAEVLDRLVEQQRELIVIITEKIAGRVRSRISDIRFGGKLPLFVEIPGPEGPSPDTPSLLEAIHEAVGIRF